MDFQQKTCPCVQTTVVQVSSLSTVPPASLGGKGLTNFLLYRGLCAFCQCTQLVPFHHTHSKHIQTQLSVCAHAPVCVRHQRLSTLSNSTVDGY